MITALTTAQNEVLDQICYLDTHFKTKHNLDCFSQSNGQIERHFNKTGNAGYCKRTIQRAIKKLEDIGLISVAYQMGFKGANLFYVHLEKLEELKKKSLDECTNASEKVKNVFHRFITDSVLKGKTDLSEPEQAKDFTSYCVNTFDESYFEHEESYNQLKLLDEILDYQRAMNEGNNGLPLQPWLIL
ncbi:hypothetical protein Q5H80_03085 [Vibrio sp. SNU_ST1]|uniref:hypothetical protein n=1 Tax=Vibrio sp. SNU_ST1 TaxID=3064001 RepID=UPI00272C86A7|nr:hypothetical protein [Vibrio sp. SNU_ST1]WKY58650.1 hypothetical protein Q5H80_03085 [Vibrio sp. SNU_ST1]